MQYLAVLFIKYGCFVGGPVPLPGTVAGHIQGI